MMKTEDVMKLDSIQELLRKRGIYLEINSNSSVTILLDEQGDTGVQISAESNSKDPDNPNLEISFYERRYTIISLKEI